MTIVLKTTFASLSKAQQRYSVILAQYRPSRDSSGLITSNFVRILHHELLKGRESGGPKIGWPRWVFVENATGASEGLVPFCTPEEAATFLAVEQSAKKTVVPEDDKVQLPVRSITEDEFAAECLAAGLTV